ncbi:unnamed protein product [Echinostoma caproni]|uniref:Uncharacterized protein n=1 Tax=Echinostoma caproni TaxID=27848 RepID=A0A3P8LEZ5_9TREM|nr:unnamed protein product [Echinostoma caproni]
MVYDDFCRIRVAAKCKLPHPEAVVYLYSLIRNSARRFIIDRLIDASVFFTSSHRIVLDPCSEDGTYRNSIRSHLNSLLTFARRSPNVSHMELIDFLFPNVRPTPRDTVLLNLIFKHYRSTVSTGLIGVVAYMCMRHRAF